MITAMEKSRQKIRRSAFSLVELSSVIIIIGILISAVIAGGSLVRIARTAQARAATLSSQITSIPGMILWTESSMIDSFLSTQGYEGAQLTTWYNREPSGYLTKNNLTTSASANVVFKEDGINNIPDVAMTGTGNMVSASFASGALTTSTVIIVFKPTVAVSSTYLTIADAGASGNSTCSIAIKSNLVNLNAGSSVDSSTSTNAASFTVNNKYILMAYFNGSSSKVFVNNITEVGGSGAVLSVGTNPLNGITIGADKSGANGLSAEISEVIVYNRILKDTERTDVMNYLSKKYKIAVTGL